MMQCLDAITEEFRALSNQFDPQRWKTLRHTLGITQKDAAKLLGISENSVSRWEFSESSKNRNTPGSQTLNKLDVVADALDEGYTIDELIERRFVVL